MSPNRAAAVLEGKSHSPLTCQVTKRTYKWRSDAFCLFYDAKTKTVKAFNGSGRSPANLTIEHVRDQGITGNNIPATNLNSVTVPGEQTLMDVQGWPLWRTCID